MKIIKLICYHAFSLILRLMVWLMDFVFEPSDSIEFCPLCKKYHVDGMLWDSKATELKGYERARFKVCYICANMLKEKDSGFDLANTLLKK